MTFINNLTAIFTPAKAALQSKPVFRGTSAAPFQAEIEGPKDSFASNPLYALFGSEEEILRDAKASELIRNRCKEYGIPLKVNMDVIEDIG